MTENVNNNKVTTNALILPPFPFPSLWNYINDIQIQNNEKFWLPYIGNPSNIPTTPTTQHLINTTSNNISVADDGTLIDEEEAETETEEVLVMNEEWTLRMLNTLERMKKKKKKRKFQPFNEESEIINNTNMRCNSDNNINNTSVHNDLYSYQYLDANSNSADSTSTSTNTRTSKPKTNRQLKKNARKRPPRASTTSTPTTSSTD